RVDLVLRVIEEERWNERVRPPAALDVAVVAVKEEGRHARVHARTRAVTKVGADEREGALCPPVRRREEQRRVKVPPVLAPPLKEERREPVVVLAGRLAVNKRPGDHHVVLSVADAPERRKQDVHIELQRTPAVIEEAVESLGVLGP